MKEMIPSNEYIDYICGLYGDSYDDRVEDCRLSAAGGERREAGADWVPGQVADHKSLGAFQRELEKRSKNAVRCARWKERKRGCLTI